MQENGEKLKNDLASNATSGLPAWDANTTELKREIDVDSNYLDYQIEMFWAKSPESNTTTTTYNSLRSIS